MRIDDGNSVGGNGGSSGTFSITDDLFFADDVARDAFFVANPSRLKDGVICAVGTYPSYVFNQYILATTEWRDATALLRGARGIQGIQGLAGTVAVYGVTTGSPGDPAQVTNLGTPQQAELLFVIPRGEDGESVVVAVNTYDPTNKIYTLDIVTSAGTTTTPNLWGPAGEDAILDVNYRGNWDATVADYTHFDNVAAASGNGYICVLDEGDFAPAGTDPDDPANSNVWQKTVSKGADGDPGIPGDPGITPEISVYVNTSDTYILQIKSGTTTFLTPNLKGTGGGGGGTATWNTLMGYMLYGAGIPWKNGTGDIIYPLMFSVDGSFCLGAQTLPVKLITDGTRISVQSPSGTEQVAYVSDVAEVSETLDSVTILQLTGATLSRTINGETLVPQNLFAPGQVWSSGKTWLHDADGTVGVIDSEDASGNFVVYTVSTSNVLNIGALLGNVATNADLPLTLEDAFTLFGRTPAIDDYVRVVADETQGGATIEWYLSEIGAAENDTTPITWGSPLVINTADYQGQSTVAMSGKILRGGATEGTFGATALVAESELASAVTTKLNKAWQNPTTASMAGGLLRAGTTAGTFQLVDTSIDSNLIKWSELSLDVRNAAYQVSSGETSAQSGSASAQSAFDNMGRMLTGGNQRWNFSSLSTFSPVFDGFKYGRTDGALYISASSIPPVNFTFKNCDCPIVMYGDFSSSSIVISGCTREVTIGSAVFKANVMSLTDSTVSFTNATTIIAQLTLNGKSHVYLGGVGGGSVVIGGMSANSRLDIAAGYTGTVSFASGVTRRGIVNDERSAHTLDTFVRK